MIRVVIVDSKRSSRVPILSSTLSVKVTLIFFSIADNAVLTESMVGASHFGSLFKMVSRSISVLSFTEDLRAMGGADAVVKVEVETLAEARSEEAAKEAVGPPTLEKDFG